MESTIKMLELAQRFSNDSVAQGRIGMAIEMLKKKSISAVILALEITAKNTRDTITAGRLQLVVERLRW